MNNKISYYERNKEKIKERRRLRYQEQKEDSEESLLGRSFAYAQDDKDSVILSEAKNPPELRNTGVTFDPGTGTAAVPVPILPVLAGTVLLFTLFLTWQGALFFLKQGYPLHEAVIVSVFGELLLIVSSALVFYAETKRTKQVFLLICSLSVFLLGAFLHKGVKTSLVESNPAYKRLKSEYELLLTNIETLKKDKEEQPENYKTIRNKIQNKIETKMNTLSVQAKQLADFESKSMGIGEYYVAWIRIALMILNAYLVHAFLREIVFH